MPWELPFGPWACAGALVGVLLIARAIVRYGASASTGAKPPAYWQERFDRTDRKVTRLLKELGVEDTEDTSERKAG